MSTSEKYVLNNVQNPKLLEIAYRSIRSGKQSKAELKDDTGLEEKDDGSGTLSQSTDGLLTFGLIRKSEYEYSVESLAFETGNWKLDFKLTMLHNVAQEADESDWGKQSAVLLNYEYLLKNNVQYFKGTSNELISKIDRWHQEIDYEPRNSRGERQKLNYEKFNHWRNQAEYLGLIHRTKGRASEYTIAPDPTLVLSSIKEACNDIGNGDGIKTVDYLKWVSSKFLRIPLTTEREFTEPIARTFYRLAKRGELEFVKHGDEEQIGLYGVPAKKNERIAKNANYIRINI
jgi:hypothetical protein